MNIKGITNLWPMLLGILLFIRIPFVGELRALELVALLFLPFVLSKLFRLTIRVKLIFIVILFIIFSQAVIDLLLSVPTARTAKFFAVYLFPIFSLLFLLKFIKTEKDFIIFCMGACVSALIFTRVDEVQSIFSENTNYFKQRYLSALIYFIPVYFYLVNRVKWMWAASSIFDLVIVMLVLYLMLVMDVRSFGLIFILSYIIATLYKKISSFYNWSGYTLAIVLFVCSYIGYLSYILSIEYFDLGGLNAKNQLDQINNLFNPLELLSLGRSSVYETFKLANDNWLTGFGSYQGPESLSWDLTTHSVIAGNFLYGGFLLFLLGVVLLAIIIMFAVSLILKNKDSKMKIFFISYFTLLFLWDYLFSPFGYLRLALPPLLLYLILVKSEKKDSICLSFRRL